MRSDELIFWLQWYLDWRAVLETGRECMRVGAYGTHTAEAAFEESVLSLEALVERAGQAPVPTSFRHLVEGQPEDEPDADPSDEGTDWPAASVPAETAAKLRALVRAPYVYTMGNCGYPGAIDDLWRLAVGVRGIRFILGATCSEGEKEDDRLATGRDLRLTVADALFVPAMKGLHFLAAADLHEITSPEGLDVEAITPFLRFVTPESPLDRLCVSEAELELRAHFEPDPIDDYREPEYCEGCDQPLDPELEYCWTCQCEGKDWD
jgi:hypothetical protein